MESSARDALADVAAFGPTRAGKQTPGEHRYALSQTNIP
jgi:hypothetical protein